MGHNTLTNACNGGSYTTGSGNVPTTSGNCGGGGLYLYVGANTVMNVESWRVERNGNEGDNRLKPSRSFMISFRCFFLSSSFSSFCTVFFRSMALQ